MVNKSSVYSLNLRDIKRSLIVFVLSGVSFFLVSMANSITPILQNGDLPSMAQVLEVLKTSFSASLSYLFMNYITGKNGKMFTDR